MMEVKNKSQMIRALKKMQIADAVDITYCNVARCYTVKVYYDNKCKTGMARTREIAVQRAEEYYCKLIEASY